MTRRRGGLRLTRLQWSNLIDAVFQRDLYEAFLASQELGPFIKWKIHPERACVARFLDPSSSGPCLGRLTFDHVDDQKAMGMKGPDDEWHLVTVCEWHHGTNRVGGGWITSKDARRLVRAYLDRLNPVRCAEHPELRPDLYAQ